MTQDKINSQGSGAVQYRRAKLWQIIMVSCTAFVGMSVYQLIGMASYAASIGYGIATVTIGAVLVFTRIFDAVTDPMLAFIYDKVDTRFGKVRVLLITGWLIMMVSLLVMYNWAAGQGHGIVMFILLYMLYIIGYTLYNMTAQTLYALITNDPKQRPMVGICSTIFNYIIPITLSLVFYTVLMPKFGGYTLEFLAAACWLVVGLSFVGLIITCIGVSQYDKPENFVGTSGKHEKLKLKDMIEVLKGNRPLQCYIVSQASDKIAQQTNSQSIIKTMLNGIIIGNMAMATKLTTIAIVPSILFAFLGAAYARKNGNKKAIVVWSRICILAAGIMAVYMIILYIGGNTTKIGTSFPFMAAYVVLYMLINASQMGVTTGNNAFMADVIDYELDRGGKYIPAVVTGVYSLVDKLISSVSGLIATGAVALIGYVSTVPQPTDALTGGVFWMTVVLMYGMPILGWIITLIAMKFCSLDKDEMEEVQRRIADKKAAAKQSA